MYVRSSSAECEKTATTRRKTDSSSGSTAPIQLASSNGKTFTESLEDLQRQHLELLSSSSAKATLYVQLEELQKNADALDYEELEDQRNRRRKLVVEIEASLKKLEIDE